MEGDEKSGVIKIGKNEATINYNDFTVVCKSGVLKGRVEGILSRGLELVSPFKK